MGITLKEWEDHFKALTPERRAELRLAIDALENDPAFKEHFDWTGLFALKYSIDIASMHAQA